MFARRLERSPPQLDVFRRGATADEKNMMEGLDCVLGSGPAAAACAYELLKAGRNIIMIDPGRRLADDRAALVEEFRTNSDPEAFVARMRRLRRNLPAELQSKKLPFSSPYVYEDVDRLLPAEIRGAQVARSLAAGGLSAMWGATVMPLSARSFRKWPITLEEMAPFYSNVAEIMDVPCVHDDLEKTYPNFGDAAPLALSEQGAQLMASLLNNRRRLGENGVTFGRCRSAVGPTYAVNGTGCVYCGLCMYGCPYRAIFNSEYVVERLNARPNFSRRSGWIAEGFEEKEFGVAVRLRHIDDEIMDTLNCERLFVACGAATSLRLVATAMKWFGETFHLMDTQLVIIPAFLQHRSRTGAVPRANALGQVFVEIDDPGICDELIHLQIYGFDPFVADLLRARWGKLFPGEKFLQPLFDRLMLVMGYLPGQISGKVAFRAKPPLQGAKGLAPVTYNGVANVRTLPAVRRIGSKLKALRREFGWWPVFSLAEMPEPGASNHLAGGLPMRAAPGPRETDRVGRPDGLRRVHVVDGACFSDVPGEPPTYTIMANAARIAAESIHVKL